MSAFERLIRLILPFKRWVVLGVLLGFLTIGSSVGLMAMSAYLISRAAIVTDVADIALVITSVRVFAILRALFRYLERLSTHTATFRILSHLRAWFYEAIEPLAPARLQAYRSGDLLARIVADIETLENFYVRVVVPPFTAALVTALACAILGVFDPLIAAALLVFMLLTGVALPLASRRISRKPAEGLIAARADLNAALVDEIQGIADLLTFDQVDQHQRAALELELRLNRAQVRMATLRGASSALAALFASLAGLTALILGIQAVTGGELEGVYLALLPLTAIASFEAIQPLALAWQQLDANRAAGQRLFEVVDTPAPVSQPPGPSPQPLDYSLQIRDLHFRYAPGETPALDGLSLSIPSGGLLVLQGSSGAGKSTLVNLLLRFWEYEEGSIRIGGHELREYGSEDARAMIGVVPQQAYLFNSSIEDNLLLANPDATKEQIELACEQAGLGDFIRSLPEGTNTLIGENGLLLSGGERQRLAIARAVLKNAPILILDEASANLDAATERRLMQSLQPFLAGRTVLAISHRPQSILQVGPHTGQVIHLENGRMVKAGV
jgi:ATP-binding cassette subfamily C protein CydC